MAVIGSTTWPLVGQAALRRNRISQTKKVLVDVAAFNLLLTSMINVHSI